MKKKVGRPSKKSYDPMAVMEELLSTVDAVFEEKRKCFKRRRSAISSTN